MTARRSKKDAPGLAWADGSLRLAEVVRVQQGHLQAVMARLEDPATEDVHQGRVAARRLRSCLKTFAPLFDARWARLYRMDLRSFARALATVREADVRCQVLEDAVRSSKELRPAEVARLGAALRRTRADARDQLRRRTREHAWKALLRTIAVRSEQPPRIVRTDVPLAEVLRLADASWRKARRMMRRHPREAAQLHELRLALKHCRYALEVVHDVEPRIVVRLLRRLRRAQDAIGAHRDTMAAAHWLRTQERSLGTATVERIEALLLEREARERRAAARKSERVLPAYEEWRAKIRRVTKAGRPRRG